MTRADGTGSPIWVTVIAARVIGGVAAGILGAAVPGIAIHAVIGAIVAGAAIYALLPRISGRAVSLFQAMLAAASGSVVTFLMATYADHRTLHADSGTAIVLVGAGSLLALLLSWIISLAITTFMVSGASAALAGDDPGASPVL